MPRSVLLAVTGIALLSVMDAIIKALVVRVPVLEVALLRYVVGTVAILPLVAVARPGWPTRESLGANALRAVIVVVTATSFFFALGRLPLAETLILSFVSPVFTAVIAARVLGESLDRRVAGALGAGFGGVILITAFGLEGNAEGGGLSGSVAGVAAVLVAALGYSASNVLLRARAQHDPVLTIVAIQNVGPAAMLALPGAWVWMWPSPADWLLLCAVGMFGVAGHLLLARAYAEAEATRLAPLDYTALIWAVLIGTFVFGEALTVGAAAGGALILGAAWLASRR